MSGYDRQPTPSERSWSVISGADANGFVDETHTKWRKPHFNEDNIPSSRIGHESATSLEKDLDAAAHTQRAISNEDSTETAGSNETQIRIDDVVGWSSGGVKAVPSTSTHNNTAFPNTTSTADTPALTLANMELHQQGIYAHNVEGWVDAAGTGRLAQDQAPLRGYSSSVASTRSAVSNGSWTHIMEPIPMDEHLAFAGSWCNKALAPYGAPKPAGN
ncbi:hypothetical protein QBC36DRAFT_29180 [Triangularia setosa]|uniref:Uncharacterized protein n=1 Tax=Triangularia setosa TaxID=2587417 RepID=A0AAN6W674_9PEZI|nr:hypothetical protein QBC36DRAFT_29180 [Podospora setosa]